MIHKALESMHPSWASRIDKSILEPILDYVMVRRVTEEVYPSMGIFKAFRLTPFDNVKVVILGQDPYYTPGMAMGLAFSVEDNMKTPPSLKNIQIEVKNDVGVFTSSNLTSWAQQGVFLLNSALTVEKNKPNVHAKIWKPFTDHIFDILNKKENVVYMLWGGEAAKKKKVISENNLVLLSNHPSPMSANKGGWFGCKHFSKCNNYLKEKNGIPISW